MTTESQLQLLTFATTDLSQTVLDTMMVTARKDSPTFTGPVNAPTPAAGNNTTLVATTAFVAQALVDSEAKLSGLTPESLNTFAEFAAAIDNNPGYAAANFEALANRVRLDIPTQALTAEQKLNAATNLGLELVENKTSKNIRDELTNPEAIAALGFTPVNKAGDALGGATFTGMRLEASPIGAATPASGAFTTMLSASATVEGATQLKGPLSVVGLTEFAGAVKLSTGSTAQRPAPAKAGMVWFNTDSKWFEAFNGESWYLLGGTPAGALFAVNYTVVGLLTTPIIAIQCPPPPGDINGIAMDYSSVWASTLSIPTANTLTTSITFTNLAGLTGSLSVSGLSAMATLNFPVTNTIAVSYSVVQMPALTSVTMPALAKVGAGFTVSDSIAVAVVSCPALEYVGAGLTLTKLAGCVSIDLARLKYVGSDIYISGMTVCAAVSLSAVVTVGGAIRFSDNAAMASASFASAERIGTALTGGNAISIGPNTAALANFELGPGLKEVNGGVYIHAALGVPAVNALLARLAALDGAAGTTAFSNRAVSLIGACGAPSLGGLTAKATLQGRGCIVTTN